MQEPTLNDNALMVFPNPSNGLSTVRYALQRPGDVEFVLLDLQGRVLLTEMAGPQASGLHEQPLELGNLANGVYLLQMAHLGGRSTVKVVLAK